MKKVLFVLLFLIITSTLFAGGSKENSAAKIGVPDDATNQARAIKLLETAGLIKVDPSAGFNPEIKDITEYIYNIEIVPVKANTLTSTLDDFAAATINGTYATPYGLVPSRDALLIESQSSGSDNPFVNIIASRSEDKESDIIQKIVNAYQSQLVAEYILEKFDEAYYPSFEYDKDNKYYDNVVEYVDSYKSTKEGKTVIRLGVCGSSNDQWNAVQRILDENGDNIYIQKVEFDAYNLPNEALSSKDIDINAFQHKAFLENEVKEYGYNAVIVADTLIAPLSLYSKKVKTLDELKALAGEK